MASANSPPRHRRSLALPSLLHTLGELLGADSSVTARGALQGLGLCADELLHSHCVAALLPMLHRMVSAAQHSYWLVKVGGGLMLDTGEIYY